MSGRLRSWNSQFGGLNPSWVLKSNFNNRIANTSLIVLTAKNLPGLLMSAAKRVIPSMLSMPKDEKFRTCTDCILTGAFLSHIAKPKPIKFVRVFVNVGVHVNRCNRCCNYFSCFNPYAVRESIRSQYLSRCANYDISIGWQGTTSIAMYTEGFLNDWIQFRHLGEAFLLPTIGWDYGLYFLPKRCYVLRMNGQVIEDVGKRLMLEPRQQRIQGRLGLEMQSSPWANEIQLSRLSLQGRWRSR